ncbi:AzlC family ABC transporter permease [Clostridia bacterium]|nr:AzlC family ABC transporter permease [Clostridia bacterium]
MNSRDFATGLRDGIPVFIGYLAVSMAFGIMAVKNGLSVAQATLISFTNFTSAGQFAGLTVIVGAGTYLEMALTQLIVNLRYCLMTANLSQKISKETPPYHRFIMGFGISDEVFALCALRKGKLTPSYTYGLIVIGVLGWTMGTFVGAFFGNILPQSIVMALGIALYGMFIAIIVPPARDNPVILKLVVVAMLLSFLVSILPILNHISSGFRIILVTLIVSGFAAWKHPIVEEQ